MLEKRFDIKGTNMVFFRMNEIMEIYCQCLILHLCLIALHVLHNYDGYAVNEAGRLQT